MSWWFFFFFIPNTAFSVSIRSGVTLNQRSSREEPSTELSFIALPVSFSSPFWVFF